MTRKEADAGKTLIEMLGVLAIIAILLIGSLIGYNVLIKRHKRQEAVKSATEFVTNIKTSNIASKQHAGTAIPAKKVLKGPKMDGSGTAVMLPKPDDGEDGWIVVGSLGGDKVVVALNVDDGTCQEMFDKIGNNVTFYKEKNTTYGDKEDKYQGVISSTMDREAYTDIKDASGKVIKSARQQALEDCIAAGSRKKGKGSDGGDGEPNIVYTEGCEGQYLYEGGCHKCPSNARIYDGKN